MAARTAAAPVATAADVARYFLALAVEDGDLITNLKMQKLVYYAYAWALVKNDRKLFRESIQAWANGPVVPSLYQELRRYGAGPIGEDFLGIAREEAFERLAGTFPEDVRETLNGVYEQYMRLSAFDLVVLTHDEKPWQEARRGLGDTERSARPIRDSDVIEEYSGR
jgi:uncharacterized phage-associated protein